MFLKVVVYRLCSSITAVSNGPSGITSESANVIHQNNASVDGGGNQATTSSMSVSKGPLPLSNSTAAIKNSNAPGTKDLQQHQVLESSDSSASIPPAPASGSYLSSSDPILVPSPDFPIPSVVGTIRCEVGSQHSTAELVDDNTPRNKPASATICMLITYLCVSIFKISFLFLSTMVDN